ncbi:MAG: phosphate ABC transporter permease subunit PstC [Kofleriaceae bacterium]|nr:phosphate ABC transporter permease subunit PstC [Kofleriaceae bacterium]MCB9574377.1 phosphate ABC transporter permease subunit PstC [Kofleriaceae bacterium]
MTASAATSDDTPVGDDRSRSTRPWFRQTSSSISERVIEKVLAACSLLSIVVTIGIVVVLVYEASDFFREVSLSQFFGDTMWTPAFADNQRFGVWPLVSGTLLTAAIAMAVALPFGLIAAIYLSEYANPTTRKVLKPALELLAGVPTIVYGFFALTVVTPFLQKFVPGLAGFNALSPGIVMGIMIIPMVSSLSEDAIYAVPDALREAAYGLGAAKLPTIFRVVVPSAWSGIAAAMTLAVSRAIGETMIVAIAAGQRNTLGFDPREQTETMTAYIVRMAKGDLPTGSLAYQSIFAVGLLLFLMTLAMNLVSYRLSRKLRARNRV